MQQPMLAAQILDMIGGRKILGSVEPDDMSIVRLVRRGIPLQAAQYIIYSGCLTPAEIDQVVISRRRLANRMANGVLTPNQSDRLIRVARIVMIAEQAFADRGKAAGWLRRPTTALSGESPLGVLDLSERVRAVDDLLGRIAHGIAA